MSFWNSRKYKARKQHTCIYCDKKIIVGEVYHRETGIFENEFNDYCLCERCRWFVDNTKYEDGDELGNLYDTIANYDLVQCPSCGSIKHSKYVFDKERQIIDCACVDCHKEWVADISIKGLSTIIKQRVT